MKPLLAVLAVLAGAFLLQRVAGFFWVPLVNAWMGRAMGQAALAQQPDAIHLDETSPDAWRDHEAAHALGNAFLEQGFADGGTHRVEEMHGVRIRLLVHEGERLYAVVYEHPQAGQWCDVVAAYEDGRSITFTTAAPTGLDPRPGHDVVHLPPTSPPALVERLRRERPPGTLRPATCAAVVRDFETAYADSTAWRKRRGISAGEVALFATQEAA